MSEQEKLTSGYIYLPTLFVNTLPNCYIKGSILIPCLAGAFKPMISPIWLGGAALAFGQTAIAINVVCSKYLIGEIPSYFLLVSRFFICSTLLIALMSLMKAKILHPDHPEQRITSQDWILAVVQGLLVGAGFNIFFLAGLKYTSASSAGIISSSLPAIITLFAIVFLKELLTLRKLVALALAITGVLVMSLSTSPNKPTEGQLLGDLFIFLAMFPEASYSIINKLLFRRMTSVGTVTIANVVAFISLMPLWYFSDQTVILSTLTPSIWGLLLVSGISSLCFFSFWAWGVTQVQASTAALFTGVMPISTVLLAALFLHERLAFADLIGMILIFGSIGVGIEKFKRPIDVPPLKAADVMMPPP